MNASASKRGSPAPASSSSSSSSSSPPAHCLVFMRAAFGDKPADQTENATKYIVNELGASELIATRIYFHAHFPSAAAAKHALATSVAASQSKTPGYHPAGATCLQRNCGQQRHSVEGRIKKAGLDYTGVRRWILANKRVVLYDEVFRDMGTSSSASSSSSSSSSTPATPKDLPADVQQKMTMKQKELGFADLPPSENLPEHQVKDESKQSSSRSSPAGSFIAPVSSVTQQMQSTSLSSIPPPVPVPPPSRPAGALKVYVKSRQGQSWDPNKVNQDRPIACVPLRGHPGVHVYGCLDGHGQNGHYVSEYVMHQLPAFLSAEKNIRDDPQTAMINAVKNVTTELAHSNINLSFSGTTCVFGVHIGDQLHVANIGDSRCIVGRMSASNPSEPIVIPLSRDHKPDSPGEMERILAAGGRVCPIPGMAVSGPNRVWLADLDEPGLAMSRSIGDEVSATVGVIDIPELMSHTITSADVCALFASDGIWEFMTNEDAMKVIFRYLDHPAAGVNALVAEAVRRWQEDCDGVIDDITVVLVVFR